MVSIVSQIIVVMVNSVKWWVDQKFPLRSKMVVYEKIYLPGYIKNQYICLKNSTRQLYFNLERAWEHLNSLALPEI